MNTGKENKVFSCRNSATVLVVSDFGAFFDFFERFEGDGVETLLVRLDFAIVKKCGKLVILIFTLVRVTN